VAGSSNSARDREPSGCQVDEVTKVQAVRMLVPQIQAMQSKDHVWERCQDVLQNGIV